jgi:hypothetical protein
LRRAGDADELGQDKTLSLAKILGRVNLIAAAISETIID